MKNFSNIEEDKKIFRNEHYFIIRDGFPVSPGHLLIISNEIRKDYFELSDEEKSNLPVVIEEAKKLIENKYAENVVNFSKQLLRK
mgnify:CR=1 FL=1